MCCVLLSLLPVGNKWSLQACETRHVTVTIGSTLAHSQLGHPKVQNWSGSWLVAGWQGERAQREGDKRGKRRIDICNTNLVSDWNQLGDIWVGDEQRRG